MARQRHGLGGHKSARDNGLAVLVTSSLSSTGMLRHGAHVDRRRTQHREYLVRCAHAPCNQTVTKTDRTARQATLKGFIGFAPRGDRRV